MRRVLIIGFLLALPVSAGAQPGVEERARRIESQVWSPYCPGRLLVDCTTQQAEELRARILQRLRDGRSERQVMDWLRDNYGDEVLARPSASGAGLALWLAPLAAILAAAVLLVGAIRRWSRATPPPPAPEIEPVPDDERDHWIAKVREEVERGS